MNKFRFTISALAIAVFTLAFASVAQGQATRTWVSGVGDDANPCSRTAPCKTFAGAISKTATDGEIDALDPAGYGAVTITKAITIDGNGWGSILAAGTNGVIVNLGAASGSNMVQLRRISMNGAATGVNGIRILSAANNTHVFVEDCVIFSFRTGTGRGISDERTGSGSVLVVENTLIKNNSGVGIQTVGTGGIKTTLNNVRAYKNSSGFITGNNANNITIARNCTADHNAAVGFGAESGAQLEIIDSLTAANGTGIDANIAGSQVRVARTTITRNTVNGLGFNGGTIISYGNNEVAGNAGNNGPFTGGGPTLQ